jgi:uncharacterized protein YjbI with pentapeptide repeats
VGDDERMSRTRVLSALTPIAAGAGGWAVAVGFGANPTIALSAAGISAIAAIGWLLWLCSEDRPEAKSRLGTGLLVGVVVATTVGGTQFAINKRQADADKQQSLRLTVGLQRSLQRIDLHGENLRGFYLAGKDLRYAQLCGAGLENANLYRADLRRAGLAHANLRDAFLAKASLPRADLSGARLQDAWLAQADLRAADLSDSDLRDVMATGADLRASDLDGADARGATLFGANLQSATFDHTDLRGAQLVRANVSGVDFRTANLRGVVLLDTAYDEHTRWPTGFRRQDAFLRKIRVRTVRLRRDLGSPIC